LQNPEQTIEDSPKQADGQPNLDPPNFFKKPAKKDTKRSETVKK
jgi:hypothetical protein